MIGPFETHTTSVPPGEQQQLSIQFEKDVELTKFVPDNGLELVRVIAGRGVNILPDANGMFTLGQMVKAKAYVVAIVKNTTSRLIIGKGQWFVEGQGVTAPQPGKQANVMSGVIPLKETPALKQTASGNRDSKGRITSYPVGRNELAVAMDFSECKRLMDMISGGLAINGQEAPAFLRRFNQALAIFKSQELPPEPATDEENQQIASLRAELEETKQELERTRGALSTMTPVPKQLAASAQKDGQDRFNFNLGYETALEDIMEWSSARRKEAYERVMKEIEQAQVLALEDVPDMRGVPDTVRDMSRNDVNSALRVTKE